MKSKKTAKTRREAISNSYKSSEKITPRKAVSSLSQSESKFIAKQEKTISRFEINENEDTLDFARMLDLYSVEPNDSMPEKAKKSRLICDINLETGMPTVEDAMLKMKIGLNTAKANRYHFARLIHGYGSTGRGGAICKAVRLTLRNAIPGEEFDIFHSEARKLLDRFPELKKDRDFGKCNHGITIVFLCK